MTSLSMGSLTLYTIGYSAHVMIFTFEYSFCVVLWQWSLILEPPCVAFGRTLKHLWRRRRLLKTSEFWRIQHIQHQSMSGKEVKGGRKCSLPGHGPIRDWPVLQWTFLVPKPLSLTSRQRVWGFWGLGKHPSQVHDCWRDAGSYSEGIRSRVVLWDVEAGAPCSDALNTVGLSTCTVKMQELCLTQVSTTEMWFNIVMWCGPSFCNIYGWHRSIRHCYSTWPFTDDQGSILQISAGGKQMWKGREGPVSH